LLDRADGIEVLLQPLLVGRPEPSLQARAIGYDGVEHALANAG
jgi:hypothetical protein